MSDHAPAPPPRHAYPVTWSTVQAPAETEDDLLARLHGELANLLSHDDFTLGLELPQQRQVTLEAPLWVTASRGPTGAAQTWFAGNGSASKSLAPNVLKVMNSVFAIQRDVKVTAHCRSDVDQMLVKLNFG